MRQSGISSPLDSVWSCSISISKWHDGKAPRRGVATAGVAVAVQATHCSYCRCTQTTSKSGKSPTSRLATNTQPKPVKPIVGTNRIFSSQFFPLFFCRFPPSRLQTLPQTTALRRCVRGEEIHGPTIAFRRPAQQSPRFCSLHTQQFEEEKLGVASRSVAFRFSTRV